MPKKLTILGALTAALVLGYFGLFNSTSQGAIQTFSSGGAAPFDWKVCYGGSPPTGNTNCGAGSSETTVARNVPIVSYTVIELPPGSRLSLPITVTPSDGTTEWQGETVLCTAGPPNNECSATTTAGDVTSRTDLSCDLGQDILASGGTGGAPTSWPDNSLWTPPLFIRTSQTAAEPGGGLGPPTAGPNKYVTDIVPFPTDLTKNGFDFVSIDTAGLTTLFLNGTGSNPIPGGGVLLQLATYESNYPGQTGLNSSVALLAGEPGNPPDDSFNCLDSPQDSSAMVVYLRTPDADRVIPRWNTTISASDLQDSSIDTILDWECIIVGTGEPDTDGDCLPNALEPDANGPDNIAGGAGAADDECVGGVVDKDCDNDLVPDGVELHSNSNVRVADSDGDTADDYTELFQFTRSDGGAAPTGACLTCSSIDSDGDGQRDAPDETPTNVIGAQAGDDAPTTGSDAVNILDDNCPAVNNASQVNTDSMYRFHGHAPSFTVPLTGTGDASNPDEDRTGDACDTDDDNDDLNDTAEASVTIVAWTGFAGSDTTVCAAPGVGAAPDIPLDPLEGDSDEDFFLDGRECQLRSRPDVAIRDNIVAEDCNGVAPTVPLDNGCAQPATRVGNGPTVDSDGGGAAQGDGLYLPGGAGAVHTAIETTLRTRGVALPGGGNDHDYDMPQAAGAGLCAVALLDGDGAPGDNDKDSDRDTFCIASTAVILQDGAEFRTYGTSPAQFDSDQDGCPDGEEAIDINGDGNTDSGDQGSLGNKLATVGDLDAELAGVGNGHMEDFIAGVRFDINKDGNIDSADQGLLGTAIVSPRACSDPVVGWEDNIDIGRATVGLP